MFDSNASGIDINVYFFAEVYSISNELKKAGFKNDSIVVCKHVEKKREKSHCKDSCLTDMETKTLVWLSSDSNPIEIIDGFNTEDLCSFVYSGDLDGRGFIDENWEKRALAFLSGTWRMTNNL